VSSPATEGGTVRRRGLAATLLAVAVVAGVVGAAALDGAGSGGHATTSAAATTRATATARTEPSLFDRLVALPAAPAGLLPGHVLIEAPNCRFRRLDLATLRHVVSLAATRACRLGQYSVDQQEGPGVVVLQPPSGADGTVIHLGRAWGVGQQTAEGVALCNRDGRARLILFHGGGRSLPSCPVAVIDGRLAFLSGRHLVDEQGRSVVALRQPIGDRYIRQLSSGVVVVEPIGRDEPTDLYRAGRFLASVPIWRAGVLCSAASASRDGRIVLAECGSAGGLVVLRDGTPHVVDDVLASADVLLSPDGHWIIDHVPAMAFGLVLNALTLTPSYRLPVREDEGLVAWTS
jgi:hypothetical protein